MYVMYVTKIIQIIPEYDSKVFNFHPSFDAIMLKC